MSSSLINDSVLLSFSDSSFGIKISIVIVDSSFPFVYGFIEFFSNYRQQLYIRIAYISTILFLSILLKINDKPVFNRLPFVSTISKGFVFIVFFVKLSNKYTNPFYISNKSSEL